MTREEYESKFKCFRKKNTKLFDLITFVGASEFGTVHVIEPEKGDTPVKLRDRIRQVFHAHFRNKVKYDITISRNREHNHVAIQKVKC
jgi:hypothetical protein